MLNHVPKLFKPWEFGDIGGDMDGFAAPGNQAPVWMQA